MTSIYNYDHLVRFNRSWHDDAISLYKEGMSWRGISRKLNVPKTTIRDFLSRVSQIIPKSSDGPKILLFDIETTPHLSYVWRCFKQNISGKQIEQYTQVLSYAAKWLGKDAVMKDSFRESLKDYQNGSEESDRSVCESLWVLFNDADIVVAHNARGFDVKMMNTRWAKLGIQPPSSYRVVDTLRIARAIFDFPRNDLDTVARYFGIKGKLQHEGFELWTKCIHGDDAAWEHMMEYNIQDVITLEELYLRLRIWDKQAPNVALYYDDNRVHCPCCGSVKLLPTSKTAKTNASEFITYRCSVCGKESRSRKRVPPTVEVLSNIQ